MRAIILPVGAALAISMSSPVMAADAPAASDTAAPAPAASSDGKSAPSESCAGKFARYYPPEAQKARREGRAVIKCHVTAQGTVDNCVVVSEDPPGLGFGKAALGMACLFKMKPKTVDGQPVDGGETTIPIRFGLKD